MNKSKGEIKKQDYKHDPHDNIHCHELGETHETCISLVPIFNHLEKEQMDEIMAVTYSISYKKGENIYCAGDKADSLYIVSKGKIKIYRLSESGKEQLLRILHPGDFTGELALFSETVHEEYAEAMEETNVCTIKNSELQEILLKYPSISLKVLAEFSSRLEQSEKQATLFATEKVETRIALFLVECMDNEKQSMEVVLPMNKKDMASYLGTTPETISRKLADLEEAGYIKQISNKKIKILNLDGLLSV
jgi:CRP/FNR family transcriptional regulator